MNSITSKMLLILSTAMLSIAPVQAFSIRSMANQAWNWVTENPGKALAGAAGTALLGYGIKRAYVWNEARKQQLLQQQNDLEKKERNRRIDEEAQRIGEARAAEIRQPDFLPKEERKQAQKLAEARAALAEGDHAEQGMQAWVAALDAPVPGSGSSSSYAGSDLQRRVQAAASTGRYGAARSGSGSVARLAQSSDDFARAAAETRKQEDSNCIVS